MPRQPRYCPATGCSKTITVDVVACPGHWYSLPKELRDRIWRLWRHEPGGLAHTRAVVTAVKILKGAPVPEEFVS